MTTGVDCAAEAGREGAGAARKGTVGVGAARVSAGGDGLDEGRKVALGDGGRPDAEVEGVDAAKGGTVTPATTSSAVAARVAPGEAPTGGGV